MKVAKLVKVGLMVRIIVDENATDDDIMDIAYNPLRDGLYENLLECVEEIVDDDECPFGTFITDK